jgi:hypothetical protein
LSVSGQGGFLAVSMLISASLILGPVFPAAAQEAPAPAAPSIPAAEAPLQAAAEIDPPARVGRVARVSGTVSFHPANAEQWQPAQMNWPVTSGSAFWTEPGATAELELSSGRIVLAAGSELDVDRLDAQQMAATLRQGDVYLAPTGFAPAESYRLQTPRALVTIGQAGRYEIATGNTAQPTRITVYQGAAQIGEGSAALQAVAGQAIVISGNDNFTMRVEPAGPDRFRTRTTPPPRRVQSVAAPAVVADMPGGADLVQYGSWTQNPDYGQVWYPQVAPGWVPYRSGHWGYVEPWGWTWIDAAPWGFAPFHYGRWFQDGGRWGWTPGGYEAVQGPVYPVYAPALVTFLGVGAGVAIAAGLAGNVGWVPLGPREPYHPWYRASPNYVNSLNYTHVNNVTVNNTIAPHNFRNFAGATQVPAAVMTGSRPVGPAAQALRPTQFAQTRPLVGQPPIQPGIATAGVTPGMARQLNIAGPGQGAPPSRPAPGPGVSRPAVVAGPVPGIASRPAPGMPLSRQPPGIAQPAAARPPGLPSQGFQRPPGIPAPAIVAPPAGLPPRAASPSFVQPARPIAPSMPGAQPVGRPAFQPPAQQAQPRMPAQLPAQPPRFQPATQPHIQAPVQPQPPPQMRPTTQMQQPRFQHPQQPQIQQSHFQSPPQQSRPAPQAPQPAAREGKRPNQP